jgi:ubiquitin carboxyl-terminal hydrolase 4/11
MNSALQSLMSSPELMEYFINDLFEPDINLVNPMGSRGEVVTIFAQLLKDTKLSKKSYVIPHQFKKAFCKFRH